MFIDYALLAKSVPFYEALGFQRIESPWTVPKPISDITKPDFASDYLVVKNGKQKIFVASGEQSFLSLINKSFLPPGKYQTITPCMRDDNFGPYHTKYFMKNELIWWGDVGYDQLYFVRNQAKDFFKSLISKSDEFEMMEVERYQWDILVNGVEVGSYGLRECSFCKWVYGTGLALPRFNMALKAKKE